MKGLALDLGEISADELNAKWLPRKATEEEMSKEQPEALRLADLLEPCCLTIGDAQQAVAAAELRRLHAENEALRAQIGQGEPVNGEWVERWHGSKTDEGWSILFQSLVPRDKVAYLGTGVSAEAVQSIVYAHNQALSELQRKPLTDEQIVDAYCKERGMRQYVEAYVAGARFAEASHNVGEKK